MTFLCKWTPNLVVSNLLWTRCPVYILFFCSPASPGDGNLYCLKSHFWPESCHAQNRTVMLKERLFGWNAPELSSASRHLNSNQPEVSSSAFPPNITSGNVQHEVLIVQLVGIFQSGQVWPFQYLPSTAQNWGWFKPFGIILFTIFT